MAEIILQMSQTSAGLERWEKGLEVSTQTWHKRDVHCTNVVNYQLPRIV